MVGHKLKLSLLLLLGDKTSSSSWRPLLPLITLLMPKSPLISLIFFSYIVLIAILISKLSRWNIIRLAVSIPIPVGVFWSLNISGIGESIIAIGVLTVNIRCLISNNLIIVAIEPVGHSIRCIFELVIIAIDLKIDVVLL